MRTVRIIFAGGGTGGHLSPAIAIAGKLRERLTPEYGYDFRFVGTKRGIEYRLKDKLGFPLELINVRGMVRSFTLKNLLVPFLLLGAIIKSIGIIRRFRPDIIVGTGGYVMGPVMLAAVLTGSRRVIQEQNSYPGVTTRQMAGRVDKVFLGFGDAVKFLSKNSQTVETGNPVKDIIGKVSRDEGRKYFGIDNNSKVILILGGSQGASAINRNIMAHLESLPSGYELIWQCGERDYKEVAAKAGGKATSRALFPYTDRIEMAYAVADIAIARAGALTLAEIEQAGLPSILVPYPFAAGDHQRKNAASFSSSGAAIIFEDSQLGQIDLLSEAVGLFASGKIAAMTAAVEALRSRRKKPAVDIIADEILELINIKRSAS
jgi:UDP-N-acetylglucosamine--N-acetylmuramyl-(pentapeptide) pyrophosphoryl-undecaprenol N-acetylglucosamine transferase